MKKKLFVVSLSILSVFLLASVFLFNGYSGSYDEYEDYIEKKDELIKQNEQLTEELSAMNEQIDLMHEQLMENIVNSSDLTLKEQSYTDLLATCLEQLSSERELLAVTEEIIATIDADIIALEDKQVYLEESLIKTVRSLHENDGLGYIEFLLGSTDIVDFLNRYEYMTSMLEYHDTLIKDIDKTGKELEAKRAECVELKAKQEESLALLEIKRVKYDEVIAECMSALAELNADSLLLEELIKLKENDMTDVENEISDIISNIDSINKDITDFEYNNWFWPGDDSYVTSGYGYREVDGKRNLHKGIDINLRYENVYSARAGTVIAAKYSSSYGYYIVIDHGNNIQTLYAHLSKMSVKVGQTVGARELIGVSGNTGWSTGPHLHFEIRVNGSYVNPLNNKKIGITGKNSYHNVPTSNT